jgi:hypothetical protein
MNCPGSVLLEEKAPAQESSVYAEEGTAAHKLAAMALEMNDNADSFLGEVIEVGDSRFKVSAGMAEAVQVYLDTIRADMENDGVSTLCIERDFTLPDISAHLYGTNDASYISPFASLLRVYDYKHGQGTYVEVDENTQLMIYALGAWQETGRIAEEIEIVIIQPRFFGADPVRRYRFHRDRLMAFRKEVEKAVAVVHGGSKTLKTGDWCKFCPAMSICEAKHGEIFAVVPAGPTLPEPGALSVEQMVKVLTISATIADWAAAVHAHAESLARTGVKIPGYKLVAKKGHRKWIDELAVETAFEADFGDAIYTKALKSPTQLEKVVGKDKITEYVEVPVKEPQLVPESAKGEAIEVDAANVFQLLA